VGPLDGNWRPSVGKFREWYMESQHLQGCSHHLCWLKTDGLAPVNKYWTYQSHAGVMSLVSWCSCVTTWPKLVSPTPRLSWGRKNEVTKGDGWTSLSLIAKTSSGSKSMFRPCGDLRKVAYMDHVRCMVCDHTWIECGKCVTCWSSFSLQGVHRFESSRLSNMSNRLFVVVST
jgi:hypothetical protein